MTPRIVYITPNAVLPANRGGRLRSHHLWRALSALGEVHTLVVGDTPPAVQRAQLRRSRTRILPRRRYQAARLAEALAAGKPFAEPGLWEVTGAGSLPAEVEAELAGADALVRHCLNAGRIERILDRVRALAPNLVVLCDTAMGVLAPEIRALGIPVVCGPHNHDSSLYASMALATPDPAVARWNTAAGAAFDEAERFMAPHVDQLWVCSEGDRRRFSDLVPAALIRVVPNVWDVGPPSPLPESRDLVFVGQGGYYPNEDAGLRLVAISRRLDALGVSHRLRLVGRAAASVRLAAAGAPSVEVLGEVPAVEPIMDEAALVPIALTLGGGTRLKILEAMAAGRPVLTTPIGIEGIEAEDGVHALIEPDLDAFPERIAGLLADRGAAQALALRGHALVAERYSREALLGIVRGCLADLGLSGRPEPAILGHNLGAEVRDEEITFNPDTRLLLWRFETRLAAGIAALSAVLDFGTESEVPNAFATLRERPKGFVLVECACVLPAEVPPFAAALVLSAWGAEVLRHRPPPDIPQENAGLLTLERTGEGLRATGWARGPARVQAAGDEPAPVRPDARGGFEIVLSGPGGGPIAVMPESGTGQSFTQASGWLEPRRPSSLRMMRLADRHRGETAWLIGNGPSVRIEDLEALQGRLTFGFNRLYLAYGQTAFRPTYTVTGDAQMIEDFGQEIVDRAGGTVFVVHDHPPDILGDYVFVRMLPIFPPLFSLAPEEVVSPGGSSLYMAMQIAYRMGVRRFFVYGADFRFTFDRARSRDRFRIATGDGNHFIPGYRSGRAWCPPSLKDIGAGFLAARRMMEREGGFVRNASRGGALEMFERTPFEAALAESAAPAASGPVWKAGAWR